MADDDGIVAFILARLGEDEAAAKAAKRNSYPAGRSYRGEVPALNGWWAGDMGDSVRPISLTEGEHAARHNPARVLREVEAKRLIMAACIAAGAEWETNAAGSMLGSTVLRQLAAAHNDHPDYRPEWKFTAGTPASLP